MIYKKLLTNFFKKNIFNHLDSTRVVQIILLMVLIVVVYFFKVSLNILDRTNPNLATLFINFETEKRLFEGEVVKDMTILDALNLAVSVGKINLNYTIDESGNVNILKIDGHTNGVDNKYFVFYVNSKKVPAKDLNKESVHNGDKIEIRNE